MGTPGFRRINFGIIFSVSLLFSGCIYSGTGEEGYFESVVDKSEFTKVAGDDGYSFSISEFYKTHRKSIVSFGDGTTTKINYVDTGDEDKIAIVFVHGTPGSWQAFWEYLVIADLKTRVQRRSRGPQKSGLRKNYFCRQEC